MRPDLNKERIPEIHFYEWSVARWLSSESRSELSLAARGLYRECLDLCYRNGSIPKDPSSLGRLCYCTREEVEAIWPTISRHFYTCKKDNLRAGNRFADLYRRNYFRYIEEQRKKGRSGGRKKEPTKSNGTNEKESSGLSSCLAEAKPEPKPKQDNTIRHDTIQHDTKSGFPPFTSEEAQREELLAGLFKRHRSAGYKHVLKTGLIETEWSAALAKRPDDLLAHAKRIDEGHRKACETNTWQNGFIESLDKWIHREGWRDDFPAPEWDGYTVVNPEGADVKA